MENLKTIKSTKIQIDSIVFMTLYRSKQIISARVPVKLLSRPDCQISNMTDEDRFVFENIETNETYSFRKNTCEPYFLMMRINEGEENSVLVRVRFETEITEEEKDKIIRKPGRPKKPEMFGPPLPKRPRGRPRKNKEVENA